MSLTWTVPTKVIGGTVTDYVVQYRVGGSGTWLTFADGVSTSTSAMVTGLTGGVSYQFSVAAKTAAGVGEAAVVSSTPLSGLPSAPQSLSASPIGGGVSLSWSPPSALNGGTVTDYVVQYRVGGSGTWLTFADGASTSTLATLHGLTEGESYEFQVAAVTLQGPGSWSSAVSATPLSNAFGAPESLSASPVGGGVSLSWSPPSALNGGTVTDYVVQYRVGGSGTWLTFADGVSTSTSALVSGLSAELSFQFQVAAVTDQGTGAWSTPVTATPEEGGPASAPRDVEAAREYDRITVTWNAPTDLNGGVMLGYDVRYRVDSGEWQVVSTAWPHTSVTLSSDDAARFRASTYEFSVAAFTTLGAGESASVVAPGLFRSWGNPRPVETEASYSALWEPVVTACPSVGNCVVGGSYRLGVSEQAFVLHQRDGTWLDSRLAVPSATNSGGLARVTSVSCASSDSCLAGGFYTDVFSPRAFVVEYKNEAWSAPRQLLSGTTQARVTAISCASPGNCVVGGTFIDAQGYQAFLVSQSAGVWGAQRVPVPPAVNSRHEAQVTSVACSSPGNCVAGGYYTDSSGRQAFLVAQTQGVWGSYFHAVSKLANSGGNAEVQAVSCASPGSCVAGGYFTSGGGRQAFLVTQVGGVWGAHLQVVPSTLNTGGNAEVASISCPTVGTCVAGGHFTSSSRSRPFAVTQGGDTWSAPEHLASLGEVSSVSCESQGNCQVGLRNYRPGIVELAGGVWGSAQSVLPSSGGLGEVSGVSCVAAGNYCVASGMWDGRPFVVSTEGGGISTRPASLEATPSLRSVRLDWAPPAALDGEPVVDYVVEYRPGANGMWLAVDDGVGLETFAIVDGLSAGTGYQFRVSAVTGSGTSEARQVATATSPIPSSRAAGADRFATSAAISQQAFPTSEVDPGVPVVFVASGANFPDALSAGPAVSQLGGPVLLTSPSSLPDAVRNEIVRLNPELIVVIGGTGAVSNTVFTQLQSLAPQVERLGGVNRYETSRTVTRFGFEDSGASVAYIAGGENFADALAAGAAAGSKNAPIILVPGRASSVDAATLDLLRELGVTRIFVVGGVGAVSVGVASSLSTVAPVERLSGADRLATAQEVNREAFNEADTVYLAFAFNFPDALGGGVLATVKPGPLFTVPGTCVPAGVIAEIQRIGASRVVLLGGSGVLNSNVAALRPCA